MQISFSSVIITYFSFSPLLFSPSLSVWKGLSLVLSKILFIVLQKMVPQSHIPPAANVLGMLGTVLWCIQLTPQIWQNWRLKETDGMPALMMLLWAFSQFSIHGPTELPPMLISKQVRSHSVSTQWLKYGIRSRRSEIFTEHLEFQYPPPNPTPDSRHAFARHLGPDPHLYQVVLLQPLHMQI